MAVPRLVVIGASSGGIEALRNVVRGLPQGFAAPICVVVHTAPQAPGVIDLILNREGSLQASNVKQGDRLLPGRIYVAPPDQHLIVEPGILRLSRGPKENRFRPAIDPLFRSAAQVYGPGAIGVILSGSLDDGASGLRTITQLGGIAVVQDPDDAMFPSMPASALRYVAADHVLPATAIGPLLASLVDSPAEHRPRVSVPTDLEVEVKIARDDDPIASGVTDIGEPSMFACPDCHGVLLRVKAAIPTRFRCHTGHAYTADSLISAANEAIEGSLWSSVRALQEGVLLLEHLQQHVAPQGVAAEAVQRQLEAAKAQVDAVRRVVIERAGLMTSTSIAGGDE